ncbi:putative Heparan-alpha-glucosaminide N-acetyltransferase [Legionella waltersii]|uniref:Putative Heparan-alpha-glucosaminide N-acetyltransferase n=2 Tax=Legionella waltersii TaxID=66969 RepID=A0A0W1A1C5_9GAMM|nr:putative Heparan-alpha-glucosaminide N-acetyltransferase [Legionella waltersii]SNV04821.1 Putative heparan-alpha-glucosaminide N-acetyltransferase [Legionella waltersii]
MQEIGFVFFELMSVMNPQRLLSLDVFRGITIVLMIFVNGQAVLNHYSILGHADWNGCTFADLVFPFFLFIVGLTTVISLHKHKSNERKNELYLGILKRTIMLFALGVFLNIFPYPINLETIRIYGILQRIAVCYFVGALLYLNTSQKVQLALFISILIGYWFLMVKIPVPGTSGTELTQNENWVAYFDQLLFAPAHLYEKYYDPEGFLSTFPAIASTLAGLLTGKFLLSSKSSSIKCLLMLLAGCVFLVISWFWSINFPMNKNLWTSSFVLWTSGWALVLFAVCYGVIDIYDYRKWAFPFKVFGMNAIFAFVFHAILLKLQYAFKVSVSSGKSIYLITYLADYFFGNFSQENAAILYASCFVLLNYITVWVLYKRGIFIKL